MNFLSLGLLIGFAFQSLEAHSIRGTSSRVLKGAKGAKKPAKAAKGSKAARITLLHINDHHSHLTESSAGYVNIFGDDIPSSVSDNNSGTTYIRAYYGGFPRIVSAFKALEAEAVSSDRDVLKLHAGDAVTGTTFYTLFKGGADAKLMTHVCFDAFELGNHEFDDGDAGLANFLTELDTAHDASSCESAPVVLGANVVPREGSPILDSSVPPIEKSKIFELSNGEKVAIVGINTAKKTMESSQPDEGTILLDEKETAQAEIDNLKADGINKIIVLTHIGYNKDLELMADLDGVDVVVGGDSHSLLGNNYTEAITGFTRGPYATEVAKADGSKVCVVQAWDYAKVIGKLDIDFDEFGVVTACSGNPVFPFNPTRVTVRDVRPRYDMSAEDAALVMTSLVEKSMGQAQLVEEDEAASSDLAVFSEQVDILSQTVVAQVSEYIALESDPAESGACDLVAQGFLLNPLSTADVAIQNRGGCRSNLEQGDFTVNDAYTLLPFSNTMVNFNMTGAEIYAVLEDAVDFYLDPDGSWGAYPRASGLRFYVTMTANKGSRINNIEVNSRLAGAWVPIDMSETYVVVTNNFIADGRDGYYQFGSMPEEDRVDTFVEYAQSFIEYAKDVNTLYPVDAENASTRGTAY